MDYYGSYLQPYYADSMQMFKRDYYKEMLMEAIDSDDQARIARYSRLLKAHDEKSERRVEWTSSETWSRVDTPQTPATQ